jgi:hypothetical protein
VALPSTDELAAGLAFVARRFGMAAPSRAGLAGAVSEAAALAAGVEEDEPAALFTALAKRPRVLLGLWGRAPALIANAHAARLGLKAAPDDELRAIRMRVVQQRTSWAEVRDWFRSRQGRTG